MMLNFQIQSYRRFFVGTVVQFGCAVALAQQSIPLDVDAELLRISAERGQQESTFAKAEHTCYRRFAVSDCLREARQVRRTALDELRRQEIILNDLQRKTRAAQTLQRIQANISHDTTPASDAH